MPRIPASTRPSEATLPGRAVVPPHRATTRPPSVPTLSDECAGTTDRPVFVDASGRRRRAVRRFAVASTAAIVTATGFLVAALLGAPVVPSALLPPAPRSTPPSPVAAPGTRTIPVPTGAPVRRQAPPVTLPTASADAVTIATTTRPSAIGSTPPSTHPGKASHATGRPTDLPAPPGHGH